MNLVKKTNPFFKLFPLLIVYIILCVLKQKNVLIGDEDDYVLFADNLLEGFYANPQHEYSFLWNGPGYPIFLTILRYLSLPLIVPKLFNSIFIYFGIVFFYKALSLFISSRKSFIISILLGLYYPFLVEAIPKLLTEALSFFLICYFLYNTTLYLDKGLDKYKWKGSIALGYLILTKIFFAYVVITILIAMIPFIFFARNKQSAKKYFIILIIGFCFTIPYLTYTYSITNKLFYFGNSGGMSLYWMSTSHENEFGDWHSFETLQNKPQLYKNHSQFLNLIKNLPPVEKDIALKNKAIENIKNNKYKFFKNWQSNLGRLFFNYPYSIPTSSNSVLYLFIPNSIIAVLLVVSFVLSIKNYRKLKSSIYFFAIFTVIYLGGISLLSCYPRFLYIILPVILIWISYSMQEFLIIKIKSIK